MDGGAWPLLVGGVIYLVNSVNERDLNRLNSHVILEWYFAYLRPLFTACIYISNVTSSNS